jgi:hypothetical protein
MIILMEGDDGTHHYVLAYSSVPATATTTSITGPTETVGTTSGGIFGAPYPVWTRMTASGSGNPPPELVFPTAVSTDSSGSDGHLWAYPTLSARNTFVAQDLNVALTSVTGQTIAYGSRIICLAGVPYTWPGTNIGSNENINFTDPPQSSTYGSQMELVGAEIPWGYGAWGSVSVGELMLIKKQGGGVAVYGDIKAPTSTVQLPGIQPTGDFVGQACSDQIGLIYCAENQGAWLWNGGNTSQKISMQLRDNFYDCAFNVILSNNYGFNVQRWQDWILFSNGWMYNPDTKGWWVFYPSDNNGDVNTPGKAIWWWSPGAHGNIMWAAPLLLQNSGGLALQWELQFDNTVGAQYYNWTSQPINPTQEPNRVYDVLQVRVVASDPQNSTSAGFKVLINGNLIDTITSGILEDPTWFRFNTGIRDLEEITIELVGTNSDSADAAPVIHLVEVGYKARAKQPSAN